MRNWLQTSRRAGRIVLLGALFISAQLHAQSNVTVRVMAANITSGNGTYQAAGINIFQGLKPDVIAIQEFKYGASSISEIRTFVDTAFGSNFVYFRESGYSIPNGVISRWPIADSGSWDDPEVDDRGIAWARIDLPGTNDLYVVSVHMFNKGTEAERNNEAVAVKSNILANFPSNSWVIVAGDCNTDDRLETAITTYKTFLSDSPIPTDLIAGGDADTNEPRSKDYDYVLPSFSLTNLQVPVVIGAHIFPSGLVFDSTVFANNYTLSAVDPVDAGDSHVSGMQHMAVIKDFLIPVGGATTNRPSITTQPQSQTNTIGGNVSFSVVASGAAPLTYQWRFFGTNLNSATTNSYSLTNIQSTNAGDYTVVITNIAGSITSSVATLTVTSGPAITNQPQDLAVAVGQNAPFTVGASGGAPLSFQWRFNTADISGATNSNYTRTNAQPGDAGNYTVVVSNSSGSVTSAVAVLTVNTPSSGATNVVISQIYGGGGNTGATYKNDFVELFNPTAVAVNVSGWSVQYAGAAGTTWAPANLTGWIQPYHYYLVQLASGGTPGSTLPAVDATGTMNISASNGKLALVNNTTTLSGSNPVGLGQVIDFVGFGTADAYEGSATAAGAPSGNNTTSILRKNGGLTDSNDNTNDFATITPPTPRNSASPANLQSTPASTPTLTNAVLSGSQFQFLITGTTGSNYVVQATTNLSAANWIPVRTNAAPFSFVESNVFNLPQRFYRGLVAP
ncbi:MAG: immunoglobulin domain-containing protein [Verrucomicrobia bacterium]|nr:immunoglobulin domain-containing protein [Verrucomicrobiota bacterium]